MKDAKRIREPVFLPLAHNDTSTKLHPGKKVGRWRVHRAEPISRAAILEILRWAASGNLRSLSRWVTVGDGVRGKSPRELSAPQSWPVRETEVGCGRWRSCARHATTTTYGVMTGLSLPVYSGGPAENAAEPKEAPMNEDTVGGYAVPVDPMDLLQCDSCQ